MKLTSINPQIQFQSSLYFNVFNVLAKLLKNINIVSDPHIV